VTYVTAHSPTAWLKGSRLKSDVRKEAGAGSKAKGTRIVMETVMNGIEKHVEYYRAHLPHDRSVIPLTIALATVAALWLLIYLVSAVGPQPRPETTQSAAHVSTVVVSRPVNR